MQWEYIPFLQYSQVAQEQMQEIKTCSPFLNPRTLVPVSSTIPTPSCPKIVPGVQVATSPLLICRSVPQIVDFVSLMIASVGWVILGFGRSSNLTSPIDLYTRALMVEYEAWRIGGRKIWPFERTRTVRKVCILEKGWRFDIFGTLQALDIVLQ